MDVEIPVGGPFGSVPFDIERAKSVEVLKIRPGDTLVVTLGAGHVVSEHEQEHLKEMILHHYPECNVVIVPDGGTLSVLRRDEGQNA